MSTALSLMLAVIVIISFTASAQEVAYVYSESAERPLESGNITQYKGTDLVASSIAGGRYNGGSAVRGSGITVEEIKIEIDNKLNMGNPRVRDEGRGLILEYPGDGTINQICSIYEHMVGNWSYARDMRGIEEFQYSNQSLEYGKGKFSGQGDCDDFSILMASLIESIGGTSRIVLAYGPNGGHAYTEVYLGKVGDSESDVQRMIAWLRKNYKVKEINTHTDLKTGDVWLNLDWWKEPGGANHPGGPFFKATNQMPIPIREDLPKLPLKPLNDPPLVDFTVSPTTPNVGENTSFDASKSRDIGGRIDSYLWDFGDDNKTDKMSVPTVNHVYSKGGPCTVILTVEDDEGATNISSKKITANNPPQANFTIAPQKPIVGDQVKFDASKSNDAEDGKSLEYHWEINNNSAIFSVVSPPKQGYDEKGMYWINLTVTDKNGAKGYKNLLLKINQLPIPRIALDSANLSLGKMINFSAESSEDLDGEIVSYAWDFGDNSAIDHNKTVLHSYRDGGMKTIRLSVRDNDDAISNISQEIIINRPPIAKFSIDPVQPEKGQLVSFDASASSDPDGKIQRYLWDFGVGKAEPEVYYSEFAEHAYNRPMKYNITVTVEDDKGAKGSFSQSIEVYEINNKPIIISLQPDKSSPQEAGSSIKWMAKAEDPEDDPISYMFRLKGPSSGDEWKPITSWSSDNTWKWDTNSKDAGDYQIGVRVKDEMHAGPEFISDEKIVDYMLMAPQAPPEALAQPTAEPVCTEAEMGSYAKLFFCLPPEVVVEPETMAEANYTDGSEVAASMLLDGNRVVLHLLYPCQTPQKELEPAELKPYLEAFDPILAQATYDESKSMGQIENWNIIAYQPNNRTIALVLMDINMSANMMATFLGNLSIAVNEGTAPPSNCSDAAQESMVAVAKEKMAADLETAREKLEQSRRY